MASKIDPQGILYGSRSVNPISIPKAFCKVSMVPKIDPQGIMFSFTFKMHKMIGYAYKFHLHSFKWIVIKEGLMTKQWLC
jgi:hypothetical protein